MGSSDVIVEVKDVHKAFRVYYDKGSMLKERVINPGRSHYELREVLKGVSYNIYRGETVALIGENGCGKSTTLKMLTKILYPNSGTVRVHGKVSSLIELGAGFHPDMSGRENIYINASILGVPEKEVDRRIEDIIRFSELEEFIDNPVRTYSSGMYMRLAFSVAINVDADILLIDEILAVGDQAFQEKCIAKLNELRAGGVTVVLVSHSMEQIKEIADRCIWIEGGRVVMDGDTQTVCDAYEAEMEQKRIRRDRQEEEERCRQADIKEPEPETESRGAENRLFTLSGVRLAGLVGVLLMMLFPCVRDIYGYGVGEPVDYTVKQLITVITSTSFANIGIAMVILYVGFSVSKRFDGIFGRIDIRILKIATALVWIFFFLFPGLDLIGQVNGGEASVNYNKDIVCYIFYLMMGCYLSFCRKSVFAKKRELLITGIAIVACIGSEVFFYYAGFGYLVGVGYWLISIVSVLIFDFCNWTNVTLRRLGLNWVVKWLGMASLRIALLVIVFYPIESFVFRYIWNFPHILMCFQLVLLWFITAVASVAVVWVVTRVFYQTVEKRRNLLTF
jgi:ABC-type polysaccharide/polyol phosphate transport system ATPase subunit